MTDATAVPRRTARTPWRVRVLLLAFVAVAVAVVWVTNHFLTERYTESTRNRAEVRLALYSGNVLSELQRNSVVPLLLSQDPALIGALSSADFAQSSQRLISYRDEIGAASIKLLDADGRTENRRRAIVDHRADALETGAADGIDLWVAGHPVGQPRAERGLQGGSVAHRFLGMARR